MDLERLVGFELYLKPKEGKGRMGWKVEGGKKLLWRDRILGAAEQQEGSYMNFYYVMICNSALHIYGHRSIIGGQSDLYQGTKQRDYLPDEQLR